VGDYDYLELIPKGEAKDVLNTGKEFIKDIKEHLRQIGFIQ